MSTSPQIASVGEEFPDELPEHHELICGRLVRKALASNEHGLVQQRLGFFLMPFDGRKSTPGGWWTSLCPGIVLTPHLRQSDPDSHWYEPDVAAWKIAVVPERPRGARIQVWPQWVCEVLSRSTADRDKGVKLDTYHRAHLDHYWLVDPEKQTLTVLAWAEDGYQTILTADPGNRVRAEPFAERELDLDWLFEFE
ncbi:MAG: Uma2 family endonuclease [Proteobacteria bacterium]|nr:Uma2 family endonuclease [Pseudomonadota bacterium]